GSFHVTGVQTCALPISPAARAPRRPRHTAACGGERAVGSLHFHRNGRCTAFQQTCRASTTARREPGSPEPEAHADAEGMLVDTRSGERPVGESGWAPAG